MIDVCYKRVSGLAYLARIGQNNWGFDNRQHGEQARVKLARTSKRSKDGRSMKHKLVARNPIPRISEKWKSCKSMHVKMTYKRIKLCDMSHALDVSTMVTVGMVWHV